jgi:hypothetical protein
MAKHFNPKHFSNWDETQKKASDNLAKLGYLGHLLLGRQKEIYDLWHHLPPRGEMAAMLARKSGKSFIATILAYEICIRRPGVIVKYVGPTLKSVREILFPIASELKAVLPPESVPREYKAESKLVFRNGSFIHFGGAAKENADGLRGGRADIVILDEAAFYETAAGAYDYCIDSVLRPMMTTSDIGQTLWITTPPQSPNHPFVAKTLPPLVGKGRYITYTIDDNPLITPEDVAAIADTLGGRESEAFRREYLCAMIIDPTRQVIPEYNPDKHVGTHEFTHVFEDREYSKKKYTCYVAADVGLSDDTFIIGAVYDHINCKVVILEESVFNGESLTPIADAIKRMQELVEEYAFDKNHIKTVVDVFEIAAHTMRIENKLVFNRPVKRELIDQIAYTREFFLKDRVIIHPKCTSLLWQCKNGQFEDKDKANGKKEFERTEEGGHLDGLAALCYLLKAINLRYIPREGNSLANLF